MNLTKHNNDPKKEPHATYRELESRLGVSRGTLYKARKHLILQQSDSWIVYAWRWSGDDTCAKIGKSSISRLLGRYPTTYHPTDNLILIGVMRCRSEEEARDNEQYFLNELERTRPDREWVLIDEVFNDIIDEAFISEPHELKKIFGRDIKTEDPLQRINLFRA